MLHRAMSQAKRHAIIPRRMVVYSLPVLLALLTGGGAAALVRAEQAGLGRELAGSLALPYQAEFVGSEKCGSCHPEHYRRQKDHHMALTGRAVSAETLDLWFSRERLSKRREWSDSGAPPRYRVGPAEVFLEAQGVSDLRQAQVAAVFGSGARGFTPISAEGGRAIRELRLSFSSHHDIWLTTPGSDGDPDSLGTPKSPEQSRDCLDCHATLLAWRGERLDAQASVFGVHCERCHGPGSAHLKAVVEQSQDAKILNPGSLAADQQVRFCGQCHRQPFDLEPLDVMSRAPARAPPAGARLMLSAGFRRSPPEKTISCRECHDPHRNVEPGSDPFTRTCLRCHASPEKEHWSKPVAASSDCISCHMPVEEKAFHGVRFTDHWIRVPGSPPPLSSPQQDEYLRYLEETYRQAALGPSLGPEKQARFRVNLGEVLFGLGQSETAFRWLQEGLSFSPTYAQRLKAAGMFSQAGRFDEAVQVLEDAIRTDPRTPEAYYQQGELLQQQRKPEEAARRYREAVERNPDFAGAHNSLGSVLGSQGKLDEAMGHFRRAIELKPDYAEAHQNLGLALRRAARLDDALVEFKDALRLKPDWPPALNALARILATHPNETVRRPTEAIRLADRAAELTRYDDPVILDTLAASYAAAGQFEKAAAVAAEAVKLASAAQANTLAEEIRARLELYRRKEPYQELPRR